MAQVSLVTPPILSSFWDADSLPRPAPGPAQIFPGNNHNRLNYIAAFTNAKPEEDGLDYSEFSAVLDATTPILWKMGTVIVREAAPDLRGNNAPYRWEDSSDRLEALNLLDEDNQDYLAYIVGLINGAEFVVIHDIGTYALTTGADLKFVKSISRAYRRKIFTLDEYEKLYFPDRADMPEQAVAVSFDPDIPGGYLPGDA